MRAVHTVGSLGVQHGGPSRSITSLCSALSELDVDVDLVSYRGRSGDPPDLLPESNAVRTYFANGIETSLVGLLRPRTGFMRTLRQAAVGNQTLLHDHGIWLLTNHASAAIARRTHLRRIISPRGMLSPWALQHRKWKKRLAWYLFQRRDLLQAEVLHVTSEQEADEVRAMGARQPIAIIPNGLAVPSDGKPGGMKPRKRALFLSRIHPKKGVLNLVEAWSQVRPPDWELVIAGPDDGGHQAEVAERVLRTGASNVSFTGAVDDTAKWDLYRSADLFVLPTFSENFGIVIGEALGMGVPVITTRGAPWSGIAVHGCGWWIDTGTEPLVAALREATSAPRSQLQEFGARGRAYVAQEFSWTRVAQDMRAVYEWMLHGGEIPACLVKS